MSQRDLLRARNDTQRRYHTPSAPSKPRERNAVFLNPANSLAHELKKCEVCYQLKELGHEFITEAFEKDTGKRRDIVDLDDGVVYEVETTKKRGARHDGEDNVEVVYV